MIRILQCVNNMHRAGLETMLMNYYRNIDRTKIQFDFLTHRPQKGDYDDEILALGGKVYYAPRLYPQNYPAYFRFMKKFFAEHPEYQIVHSHIDAMSYLPLLAAKKAGVPVRIAHSHSTSIDRDFKYLLKQCFRLKLNSVATECLACGEASGRFLFGNRLFQIVPNAVDADKFLYSSEIRAKKRKELNIEQKIVIGHVGRFCYPKNHVFLIKIFEQIRKLDESAVLLLVGVGEKEQEIRQLVCDTGLEKNVKFLGNRRDVNELYQAMDVFVMPSLFEGVPLTGVEAQFAGLPCYFSDKVHREVDFSGKCVFMSLADSPERWSEEIISHSSLPRAVDRIALSRSQYNIKVAHGVLEGYYKSLNPVTE